MRPSRGTGRKEDTADAEQPSSTPSVKKRVSESLIVGKLGGICSRPDSGLSPGCAGGRSHRVARPGQVGTACGGGCACGIPQRPRPDQALSDDGRHHRSEETASAGSEAAFREQAPAAVRAPNRSGQRTVTPALPARTRRRRFRNWRCADCWAKVRPSRPRRSEPCGTGAKWSWRLKANGGNRRSRGRGCCAICSRADCDRGGPPSPMDTWGSGRRWARSFRTAQSYVAGIIDSSTCSIICPRRIGLRQRNFYAKCPTL